MKTLITFLMGIFLLSSTAEAADIAGIWTWLGYRDVRFVLKIYRNNDGSLISTLGSPDQGFKDTPFNKTEFKDGKLNIEMKQINSFSFDGVMNAEGTEISGELKQPGALIPLVLKKIPVASWEKLSKPEHKVKVERKVMIPMTDGVRLAADIYLPEDDKKHPAILVRTPYNRKGDDSQNGSYYARRGYVFVTQDVRGRFDSEGEFIPFRNDVQDGSDTIDWIASQPWCNGKVGMIGASYGGWVQLKAAMSGNPHLKAIVPLVAPPGMLDNIAYDRGAFTMYTVWWAKLVEFMEAGGRGVPNLDWEKVMFSLPLGDMDEVMQTKHPFLDEWLEHPPTDTAYWEPFNYKKQIGKMNVPALHISGWFDVCQTGALQNYVSMREQAITEEARKGQYLIMGPWEHNLHTGRKLGDVDFGPEALVDLDAAILRFYDYYLKGIENGIRDDPHARIFVMGKNQWVEGENWPPKQTVFTKLYLNSNGHANRRDGDGVLILEKDKKKETSADVFSYDPMDITESLANYADFNDTAGASATADHSVLKDRDDVLDYTSQPLAEPVEFTGPFKAHLWVSTDAADTDFVAKLYRLTPDGKLRAIATGIQRLRYRFGPLKDAPVVPGKVVEISIDCWASSIQLDKGDRLRLEVSSSDFPTYARNLNTLEPIATAIKARVAVNRVFHDRVRASHLVLPVSVNGAGDKIRFVDGN